MAGGGAKQIKMATATEFQEEKGGREGSGRGNVLSVQERDIPRYKTTNIIAMVLRENYNAYK